MPRSSDFAFKERFQSDCKRTDPCQHNGCKISLPLIFVLFSLLCEGGGVGRGIVALQGGIT